jgi:hypothetical protein
VSTPALEAFLARLYTDAALRARFLADREASLAAAALGAEDEAALRTIDAVGLQMAASSLAAKRARLPRRSMLARLRLALGRDRSGG